MSNSSFCGRAPLQRRVLVSEPVAFRAMRGLAFCSVALTASAANAENVQFNSAFLPEDSRHLDLSAYQSGNPVLPGRYRADVMLNGQLTTRQDVRIDANSDGSNPVVCVTRELLELLGVDVGRLSTLPKGEQAGRCPSLGTLIESASATFTPESQLLEISIPQAAMRHNARGHVSPELWNRGVTAGMLSYNLNTSHNTTRSGNFSSAYLGLDGGFNLGGWRLRHSGAMSWQPRAGSQYHALNTYVQRDVTSLKSQLTLGQANTSGEIFDTLAYNGVQLASDDRMLPDSMRGYAPVIRGIARTNARVTIRQSGNVLLETTVAPGAFVINDLYPTGYGGHLNVTVSEADGSQQIFVVPYASVSQLLRPGTMRFSLTGGRTRSNFVDKQSSLLQGTFQYGLNNNFTAYGGVQASDAYRSFLAGLAFGTPIGAVALDLTHAQTDLLTGPSKGQSMRVSYSKNILSTGSNFALAAYRYSTKGFLDFSNAMQQLDAAKRGYDVNQLSRPRSRLSLSVDQSLGTWGQIAISGYTQDYWNRSGTDVQYQASYSKQVGRLSFGISANRSRSGHGDMMNRVLLTMSIPLGALGEGPQLTAQAGRDPYGKTNQQATLSGTAGEDRQYGYGATFGRDSAGKLSTALNGQYTGPSAMLTGSLGRGDGYRSASFGMSGTVVAHPGGVTLTPYRGETIAVIKAQGAQGAKVVGYPGLRLDASGHAVVPYLRPYELNEVAIDPVGTSMNVELGETSQQVAPRAGAVVYLKYGTRSGRALLLNVRLDDGSPLPFGANVVGEDGSSVGVAGQGGQLYVRVKEDTRQLVVSWGNQARQRCTLALPALAEQAEHSAQNNHNDQSARSGQSGLLKLDSVCSASQRFANATAVTPDKK
ncbi:fimbria/pilus outer membrane usher protein [Variovorax sp. J22G73]|uniref:fimbria/pilus outer membrane usher protein n=1 Tax=unclassified Variovorax TaxID=663243 RepID=UPI002574B6FE|nr:MULTISPECIES: fimbria/pilus outer membrane usher protein [unclassified Variovorax]MDM0004056.1 fimbria/pilus outer membrane usher protein [Variovorax sp. J22R203]MDM0096278.1 fimbria/pilus outer membrane usher protein [Variovorax sp. J22G73]